MELSARIEDQSELYLRRAENTTEDAGFLFRLRNDPVTRENSFHKEEIPWEEHLAWFSRMMEDPDRAQLILMYKMEPGENVNSEDALQAAEAQPAGQLRLDRSKDESGHVSAEISYAVSPELRGCGLGFWIIRLAEEKVKEIFPDVQTLTAEVLRGNTASERIFTACGFSVADKNDQYTTFKKE